MNEYIRGLIELGFHEENLKKLVQLCRERVFEAPAVYGTLTYIFQSFADEYDNQAIETKRYELILATVKEPILLLLKEEQDPAIVFDRLNEVFRAFSALKGMI
jgi:hypothetical protein